MRKSISLYQLTEKTSHSYTSSMNDDKVMSARDFGSGLRFKNQKDIKLPSVVTKNESKRIKLDKDKVSKFLDLQTHR